MAIYSHLRMQIHPLFDTMTGMLQEARLPLTGDARKASNMIIVVSQACLVEGILEEEIYRVLNYYRSKYRQVQIPAFETRKPVNTFMNRIMGDVEARVARTTGVDNYAALLDTLLGGSLLSARDVAPCTEGLRVLFQLRNVLAHGRAVRATVQLSHVNVDLGEEDFRGGYSRAEQYLLKMGLIDQRFTSAAPSEWILSDDVADHFVAVARQFIEALRQHIDSSLGELEKMILVSPQRKS